MSISFIHNRFQPAIAMAAGLLCSVVQAMPGLGQTLPSCEPPGTGEFILLVATPTATSEAKLKEILPPTVNIPLCNYLGNQVSRMGGFRNFSDANAWAEYINQASDLQAFVAQPSAEQPAAAPPPEEAAPASIAPVQPVQTPAIARYAPQPLGQGFAVIVDFANTLNIAQQLSLVQSRPPGLVSYGGQAYLLARYTADSALAFSTLQDLAGKGFQVFIIDAQQTVLLAPAVRLDATSSSAPLF